MRKLLPGSVALIALGLSFPAMAADLEVGGPAYKAARPVVRAYDWSGFYVGGNVGGHWAFDRITTITDPGGGFGPAGADAIDAAIGTLPREIHRQAAGWIQFGGRRRCSRIGLDAN
jgi:outer membrane immunogenic protein